MDTYTVVLSTLLLLHPLAHRFNLVWEHYSEEAVFHLTYLHGKGSNRGVSLRIMIIGICLLAAITFLLDIG